MEKRILVFCWRFKIDRRFSVFSPTKRTPIIANGFNFVPAKATHLVAAFARLEALVRSIDGVAANRALLEIGHGLQSEETVTPPYNEN